MAVPKTTPSGYIGETHGIGGIHKLPSYKLVIPWQSGLYEITSCMKQLEPLVSNSFLPSVYIPYSPDYRGIYNDS